MGDAFIYTLIIFVIVFFALKNETNTDKPSKPKNYYYNPFGKQYYEIMGFKIGTDLVCWECLKEGDDYYEYKLSKTKEPMLTDNTNSFLMGWDVDSENKYFCSRCRKIFEFKDDENFDFNENGE